MIVSAISTSYSSTTRGGASRSALLPAPRSSNPLRNARSTSSCGMSGAGSRVARSFTNSTPIMRPRPRTSPIAAYFSCRRCTPASSRSPRRGTFGSRSRSTTSRVASAAAQHTGFPPNVLPCAPGDHFMTDSLAMMAPIGMPLPRPFAASSTSGSTPSCSHAHIFPVRPTPHCTSSHTSRMPWRSHSSRNAWRYPGGGTT